MSDPLKFPVKLDDGYPCRGLDPDGNAIYFHDLLWVGTKVGGEVPGDPLNAFPPFGVVVCRDDGLWIEAEVEPADCGRLAQPGYWLKSITAYGPLPTVYFTSRTYFPVSRPRD